ISGRRLQFESGISPTGLEEVNPSAQPRTLFVEGHQFAASDRVPRELGRAPAVREATPARFKADGSQTRVAAADSRSQALNLVVNQPFTGPAGPLFLFCRSTETKREFKSRARSKRRN